MHNGRAAPGKKCRCAGRPDDPATSISGHLLAELDALPALLSRLVHVAGVDMKQREGGRRELMLRSNKHQRRYKNTQQRAQATRRRFISQNS